MHSVVCFYL